MNKMTIAGVVANCVIALLASQSVYLSGCFKIFVALFAAVTATGAVLVASGAKKPGAFMIIIGSIVLVPTGLIAIYGIGKMLEEMGQQEIASGIAHNSQPPSMWASMTAGQKYGLVSLLLLFIGAVLSINTLKYYVVSLNFYLLVLAVLADCVGAVLLLRQVAKKGGVLILVANIPYLARGIWFSLIMIDSGEFGWSDLVIFVVPTLLCIVGAVIAIRKASYSSLLNVTYEQVTSCTVYALSAAQKIGKSYAWKLMVKWICGIAALVQAWFFYHDATTESARDAAFSGLRTLLLLVAFFAIRTGNKAKERA